MSAGPATIILLREFVFSNCGCGGSGATETLRTAYTGSCLDDAAWMSVPCEQPACVALRKMTPATLEAMDAAAQAHEAALKNWRECVVVVARTGLNDLSETEQELLLGTLLERRIQRLREASNGHA